MALTSNPTPAINKRLIAERFAKARTTYDREAQVQQLVAKKMISILRAHTDTSHHHRYDTILELGCGTGYYSRLLYQAFQPRHLLLNDLCPNMIESLSDLCSLPQAEFRPGDAEEICRILPPESLDLITSCSTLQWFVHLHMFFRNCRKALKPQGLLAFSSFGPENLREIRQLTGHGLYYPPSERLVHMLSSAGLQLLHIEERESTMTFTHPSDVLRHLKRTGVTGIEKPIWTRTRLQHFYEQYLQRFARPDGQVTLTYQPIYIIAQAP